MNDFEDLLQEQIDMERRITEKQYTTLNKVRTKPQKASKSASLNDFIKMVDKLVTLAMPSVKFVPEEEKVLTTDAMKDFNSPVITYKLISREPKEELKPRVREVISEEDELNESRLGQVFGQKFKCLVEFNIIASVYTEAEEVMEKFEDLIITYAGFLKKNGVSEILFNKQITDDYYTKYRETLSIRNLIYYVEIEKLTVIFKEKIKDIEILAQKKEEI